jgi:hypothetical protein
LEWEEKVYASSNSKSNIMKKQVRKTSVGRYGFLFFLLSMLLIGYQVKGQELNVSGRVTSAEDGTPLPGVSITIKGTSTGTQTDIEGRYTLSATRGSVLVFSYIGTVSQELAVGNATTIDVALAADVKALSEVVITAFGIQQEKRSINYAAQSVSAEVLTRNAEPNIVTALQGKIAGAYIQNSGGAPGAGTNIVIRGLTSVDPNRSSSTAFPSAMKPTLEICFQAPGPMRRLLPAPACPTAESSIPTPTARPISIPTTLNPCRF